MRRRRDSDDEIEVGVGAPEPAPPEAWRPGDPIPTWYIGVRRHEDGAYWEGALWEHTSDNGSVNRGNVVWQATREAAIAALVTLYERRRATHETTEYFIMSKDPFPENGALDVNQ